MKVIAYPTTNKPYIMRPATPKREWMDNAVNKNPYRCLPLSMANSWGWEVLSPSHFIAEWNGGQSPKDVTIKHIDGEAGPSAHFGEGTITWHTGYIYKMEHPYGLYVTGAPNFPYTNIIPLSGIVEASWLSYSFTMNWRFTQPGSVEVKIGDPICQMFPVDMTTFDNVDIEIRSLHEPESKEYHDDYWNWNISRSKYMSEQRAGLHNATVWQRHYFKGLYPETVVDGKPMGDPGASSKKCPFLTKEDGTVESYHRTKPNVPDLVDKQIGGFETPANFFVLHKQIEEQRAKERAERQEHTTPAQPALSNEQELQLKLRELELKLKIAETQLKIQSAQPQVTVSTQPAKKTVKKKAKIITVEE